MLRDKKEFWGEGSRRNTQHILDWGCLDASSGKQKGVLGSTLKTKKQSGTEARKNAAGDQLVASSTGKRETPGSSRTETVTWQNWGRKDLMRSCSFFLCFSDDLSSKQQHVSCADAETK